MITLIFALSLVVLFKLTGLFFKIFGKLIGFILGIVGFCILGALVISSAGVVLTFVAIPILAVVGVASLVKAAA